MAAAAAASSAAVVDDVGYETARLKMVDVMGQICTMLRQRGMCIRSIHSRECFLGPIAGVATPEDQVESERLILSMPPPETGSTKPTITASIPDLDTAPPHSIARVHIERGIAAVGQETWVYMFNAGKVGIKQTKIILDGIAHEESPGSGGVPQKPSRIIVVSREKMTNQAEESIRSEGYVIEKFLLNELSYNITRHFLVPRHEMCDAEQIAKLRKIYPKMALQSREDPITRFYGMVPGDVILYRRVRTGSMGAIYYREVF